MKEFTSVNFLMIGTQFIEKTGTIKVGGLHGGGVVVGIKKIIDKKTFYKNAFI